MFFTFLPVPATAISSVPRTYAYSASSPYLLPSATLQNRSGAAHPDGSTTWYPCGRDVPDGASASAFFNSPVLVQLVWSFPPNTKVGIWPFCTSEGFGYMTISLEDLTQGWTAPDIVQVPQNSGNEQFEVYNAAMNVGDQMKLTVYGYNGYALGFLRMVSIIQLRPVHSALFISC